MDKIDLIAKTTSRSPIRVEVLHPSIKGNRLRAQLRQVISRHYPGGTVSSSMQDNVYSEEDFSFTPTDYDEQRVAFIDVPASATIEDVQARIDSYPDACIYRVLSSAPILTDTQKSAISSGIITLDKIADKQLVRNEQGAVIDAKGETLDPLDAKVSHRLQFRQTYFSKVLREDIDIRNAAGVAAMQTDMVYQRLAIGGESKVTSSIPGAEETFVDEQEENN